MVKDGKRKNRPDTVEDRQALAEKLSDYAEKFGDDAAARIAAKYLISYAIHRRSEETLLIDMAGEVLVRVEIPSNETTH